MNELLIKTQEMNDLLDRYESLLTQRQLDVMNLYFKEDLSYQEIADDLGITKSAIYDIIRRVTLNLGEYEEKLQLVKKYYQLQDLIETLKSLNIVEVNKLIKVYEEETHG
ncbi:MAG: hypothetical protein GX778_02320 [Erysipelothrix sp.]|nr:hypothetical protein [Erysipelothrix sp.]